jgi:hypothetical protein
MIKNNQTLNDYNKERQLLYYTFDNRVLIQRIERSFEKYTDHKILFTNQELKDYMKEWNIGESVETLHATSLNKDNQK